MDKLRRSSSTGYRPATGLSIMDNSPFGTCPMGGFPSVSDAPGQTVHVNVSTVIGHAHVCLCKITTSIINKSITIIIPFKCCFLSLSVYAIVNK